MSKRIDAYQEGIERIHSFMHIFLNEGTLPSKNDIVSEYSSISSLRPIPYSIHLPENPIDPEIGFVVLIGEEYERYDDTLPCLLRICILSGEQDSTKEINRYLTVLPIG